MHEEYGKKTSHLISNLTTEPYSGRKKSALWINTLTGNYWDKITGAFIPKKKKKKISQVYTNNRKLKIMMICAIMARIQLFTNKLD